MQVLVHFIPARTTYMWMISGTAKKRKCYPIYALSERLTQPLKDNLLGFHAFTGCDRTSAFSLPSGFVEKCFVMENSHQLNKLSVTCMAHLSTQLSTMPEDFNFSVRPNLLWRRYPKQEAPWKFTQRAPAIRQRSGSRQTRSIYTSLLPPTSLYGRWSQAA